MKGDYLINREDSCKVGRPGEGSRNREPPAQIGRVGTFDFVQATCFKEHSNMAVSPNLWVTINLYKK